MMFLWYELGWTPEIGAAACEDEEWPIIIITANPNKASTVITTTGKQSSMNYAQIANYFKGWSLLITSLELGQN